MPLLGLETEVMILIGVIILILTYIANSDGGPGGFA